MNLDYRLPIQFQKDRIDYSQATEWFLRNEAPLGDIVLNSDSIDFTTNEASVPILDFAYCIKYTLSILDKENEDVFDFLDGEREIFFKKDSGQIEITCNYKDGMIKVSYDTFCGVVKDFFYKVEKELKQEYPGLKDNIKFDTWYHREL